jgi:hypothetical protein
MMNENNVFLRNKIRIQKFLKILRKQLKLNKMKKLMSVFAVFLMLVIIHGCSSLKVTSDVDNRVDFSQIKTFEYYGWAEDSDKLLTTLDKERIESAFANEFKKRGMSYVENGGDAIVALYIVAEQKTQTTATTTGMGGTYGGYGYGGYYGYGPGWGWGGGMTTTTYRDYDYTEGTLVISMFNPKTENLIWTSVGTKTVGENPQAREKRIPKVVAAIMSKYPVKPMK